MRYLLRFWRSGNEDEDEEPQQYVYRSKSSLWRKGYGRTAIILATIYARFRTNHHIIPWRHKASLKKMITPTPIDDSSTSVGLSDGVCEDLLNRFCEETDFLSSIRLMATMTTMNHAANAENTVARMNLLSCQGRALKCSHSFEGIPLVYDTGASYGLTPFRRDFIDYQTCNITVKDISKTNHVRGIGTVMYKFVASNGDLLYLTGLAYHLETADIRLFSPQAYHQLYGGRSVCVCVCVSWFPDSKGWVINAIPIATYPPRHPSARL